MARLRSKMLKTVMEKLRKSLSLSTREGVPGDVREGHFVIHVINEGELRRFIVGLSYLTRPDFLRLLEQAEEEFGFKQEGVLVIPCHPDDLQRVLGDQRMSAVGKGRSIEEGSESFSMI